MKLYVILTALLLWSISESSLADDSPFHDDWLVRFQAEKLERQFTYSGSTLNKVAKVAVDYYPEDNPDNKTEYETLWFNDGKPIGLERKNEYKVPPSKSTKIQVINKKGTTPEIEKAVADAIMRVSLDAYISRNAILSIKVPKESYDGIVDQLHELHCEESKTDADEADKALMSFSIETEAKGPHTILYFY